MPITPHSLSGIASRIDQPFSLVPLGLVGDMGVHLFVAQGQLNWHKHLDEDELFLVHEGAVQLETELGSAMLHAEEAMLVPKGVGHRSTSVLRSLVLLFRQQVLPDRSNGHRNYLVTGSEPPLAKARLATLSGKTPYETATAAMLSGFRLSVFMAADFGPSDTARPGGVMFYTMRGAVAVESKSGEMRLEPGEVAILPAGTAYKLHAVQPALVVKFEKEVS